MNEDEIRMTLTFLERSVPRGTTEMAWLEHLVMKLRASLSHSSGIPARHNPVERDLER
jgi:hypothetical protein